jgi:hypothetical protein
MGGQATHAWDLLPASYRIVHKNLIKKHRHRKASEAFGPFALARGCEANNEVHATPAYTFFLAAYRLFAGNLYRGPYARRIA